MTYGPTDVKMHLINCFVQMFLCTAYFIMQTTILCLFLCFGYYIRAFCEDFRMIFDRMDERLKHRLQVSQSLVVAYKFEEKIIR